VAGLVFLAAGCGRSDLLLDEDPLSHGMPDGGSLRGGPGGSSSSSSGSGSGGQGRGADAASNSASGGSSNSGTGSSSGGGDVFQSNDGTGNDGAASGPDVTDSGVDGGPGCNPGTCAGCCILGVCTPGRFRSACGAGGVACQACDVEQSCSPVGGVCE
jgi:hypothetical protein